MQISQLEERRTGLLQFLIILIILVLGFVTFMSIRQSSGPALPSLTVLSLVGCLYVMAEERRLKKQRRALAKEVAHRGDQIELLGDELNNEAASLDRERGLSAQLGDRLKVMTGLYRAISAVNSVRSHDSTYDAVLTAGMELVGADRGSIMLRGDDDILTVVHAVGLDPAIAAAAQQKVGEGIAGWVVENGEPVLVEEDPALDERFRGLRHRDLDLTVAISVPLSLRGRIVGTLNLGSTVSETLFADTHMRFAAIYAQHASVVIQNAHLTRRIIGLEKERQQAAQPQREPEPAAV